MDNSLKNGPSPVLTLLKNLITSQEEDKVKCLQLLGKLIFQNPKLKNEFLEVGGISIVLKYLNHSNPAIVGTAFHVLGFSLDENVYYKRKLSTLNIFSALKNHLKGGLQFLMKCALFLTATIVEGNDLGQAVVRESGCLYYLVKIFYSDLRPVHSQVTEEELTYWTFLCPALKACVENPHNHLNQHQAGLIIPKAIAFLENWFQLLSDKFLAEKTELLVSVLVSIIRENETNQLGFAAYSGIRWTIRGLQALAGWQSVPNNVDTLRDKIVALLAAAVEKNAHNCEESTSYGAIPLLLFVLPNAKDKYKLRPLLALTHLVHNCSRSKEEFVQENGIATVVKATVNFEAFPDTTLAAKRLLKYCAADIEQLTVHQSDTKKQNISEINADIPCSSESAATNDPVHADKNGNKNTTNTNSIDHASKSSSGLESNEKKAQDTEVKNPSFASSKCVKVKKNLLCANCSTCSNSSQSSHKLKNTLKQRRYSGKYSDVSPSSSSFVASSSENNNSGQIRERFSRLHLYSAERESFQNEGSKAVFCDQQKIQDNIKLKLSRDDPISKNPCCTVHLSHIPNIDTNLENEVHCNNIDIPHRKRKSEPLTESFNIAPKETNIYHTPTQISREAGEQQIELIHCYDNDTTKNDTVKAQQVISKMQINLDTCKSNRGFHLNSVLCRHATHNVQEKLQGHYTQKHHDFKGITENSQNVSDYTSCKNQSGIIEKCNKNRPNKISRSDTEICFKKPHQVIISNKVHSKYNKNKNKQEVTFGKRQFPLKRKCIEPSSTASKYHCPCRETNGNCNILESFQDSSNKVRRFRNCQSDIEASYLETNKRSAQCLFRKMPSKHDSDCEDSNTESVVSNTIKNKIKELHSHKYKAICLQRMLQTMQSESQNAKIERYLNSYSDTPKAADAEDTGYFEKSSNAMAFMVFPVSADAQSVQPSSRLSTPQRSLKGAHISPPVRSTEASENENSIEKSYQANKATYSLNITHEHAAQSTDSSSMKYLEHEQMHSFLRNQNSDASVAVEADVQANDAFNCETESINSTAKKRIAEKGKTFPEESVTDENRGTLQISQDVWYPEIQNNTKSDGIVEQLLKNISITVKEYMNNCMPATSVHKSPESIKWFTPQESISSEVQLKQSEQIKVHENLTIHSEIHDNSDECSVAMTPAFPCSFEASQRCFSEPVQTPLSRHKQSNMTRKQLFPAKRDNTNPNKDNLLDHERRKENMSDCITEGRSKKTFDGDDCSMQEATEGERLIEDKFPSSSEDSHLSESRIQLKRRRSENKHYRLLKYTETELHNLISGVQKYGTDFKVSTRDK